MISECIYIMQRYKKISYFYTFAVFKYINFLLINFPELI